MAARRCSSFRRCGKGALAAAAVSLVLFLAPAATSLPVDTSPPVITYALDAITGTNGWYRGSSHGNFVVLKWTVTDPDSTVTSTAGCEAAIQIPGPNTGTTRTCTATSDGGTTSVTTKTIKIDADPPTGVASTLARGPDQNGWYNRGVGITWSGADATSGLASCTSTTYTGPDSGAAAPTGTCTDNAGNTSAAVAQALKYDSTPPAVTPTPGRPPDANGWYNHAVGVSWSGNDPTSGLGSCSAPITYSGPDASSTAPTGICTDVAGNSASASLSLKYDATPPSTIAAATRAPDSNGWYNHAIGVTWSGADATSGIAGCSAATTYSGPDTTSAAPSGSCTDKAGNSTAASLPLKYDASAPVNLVGTPARAPDHNGWYDHGVGVSWSATDAMSGIASCPVVTYTGPDSASASATGTCTDKAGNSSSASYPLKFDSTPPTALVATPARGADHNGWYNHAVGIAWSGGDATSGIDSCSSTSYSGPDSAAATAAGTCSDKAGNTAPLTFSFKYDATGPKNVAGTFDRPPDANGWFNHKVSISWSGADATSGIAGCSPSTAYGGPDGGSAAVTGSCTDVAGNVTTALTAVAYDETPPVNVTAAAARPADHDGWYNHPVAIAWTADDATSGIGNCTSISFTGPDGAANAPQGECTDRAGNTSAAVAFALEFDATPPAVAGAAVRPPDVDGWYNHPFAIGWSGSDATSGIAGCSGPGAYAGPDSDAAVVAATCSDKAGNAGSGAIAFRYDATAPAVSARPARPPDHGGWYNHPIAVGFAGSDAVSGVDSCSSTTYAGPFIRSDVPSGSCVDRAGNVGYASFPLDYDDTAPALDSVTVDSGERGDVLHWRATDSSPMQVTVARTARGRRAGAVVYRGAGARFVDRAIDAGREYRYDVQATDDAGNASPSISVLAFPKVLTLARVGYVPRTSGAPILRFPPARAAAFYHVQLFKDGKRVFGAWPRRPRLALPATWNWAGRHRHLEPGRYRWYAWAWIGSGRAGGYRLLGWADFIETR